MLAVCTQTHTPTAVKTLTNNHPWRDIFKLLPMNYLVVFPISLIHFTLYLHTDAAMPPPAREYLFCATMQNILCVCNLPCSHIHGAAVTHSMSIHIIHTNSHKIFHIHYTLSHTHMWFKF